MSRHRRSHLVHEVDADGFARTFVHEAYVDARESASDWAEAAAKKNGKSYLVSTEEGRALSRFDADGHMEYLGY